MDKMETVKLMLNSINEDNMAMGTAAGMDQATLQEQLDKSQDSLTYLLSNVYDKLVESGVIK